MNVMTRILAGSRPRLAVEAADLAWAAARAPAWDRLVERAAYPNPFHARPVLEAHGRAGLAAGALLVVAAHRDGELAALAPVRAGGPRLGLWRRAGAVWTSPYAVNGTPLVDADRLEEGVDALLDGFALLGRPALWRIPLLSLDSPVGGALQEALRRRGWPGLVMNAFERPVLDLGPDGSADPFAALSASRRKTLRRRREALAALGALEHRAATQGPGLRAAVEAFLTLEASGWKGRRGTALASRPDRAAFSRALFDPGPGPVQARADLLLLDGAPVAASLALVCGGTAHLLKTAYDEAHRRHGPGVLLEEAIMRACGETRFARRLDSASLPGGVLDGLYPGRERLGDLLLATSAGFSMAKLKAIAEQELRARSLLKRGKDLYWSLRDRLGVSGYFNGKA